MHGLNEIIRRNQRAQDAHDGEGALHDELASNRKLLEDAPQLTGYEQQILHYSKMLQRLASGESFAHVAAQMGPAINPNDGR